jgi:hypothetical protein
MLLPVLLVTLLVGLGLLVAEMPRILHWDRERRRTLRRLDDIRRLR